MSRKLLMIASTVSPRWGSEGAVGWNWLINVPEGWSTTLATSPQCKREVAWAYEHGHEPATLSSAISPTGCWTYSSANPLLARVNEWLRFAYNIQSFKALVNRLLPGGFNVIHQTTIASWMLGMPFHTLGVPTVWGPIGGGENFPWRYALETSAKNWFFEGGRVLSGLMARLRPSVVSAVRNVDVVIVTNRQTEELLRSMGRTKRVIRQPMVITRQRFDGIRRSARPKLDDKLRIISGGSVEGRKGFALTIKALSELKMNRVPFDFTITGHGMEIGKLRKLAHEVGVAEHVHFETSLTAQDFLRKLTKSHVFCFPSLRDNSPVTLVEAMAAGCVPIVLNNGGPAEVVDAGSGIVLPLESPPKTIARIAQALMLLYQNKDWRNSLATGSLKRVEEGYLDSILPKIMAEAYAFAARE